MVDNEGKEHLMTTLICYEDILPAFTNRAVNASKGASELLINMTNDAWFGATTEPWEHLALAQLRAIEHRRYLVRSTNSGVSAIVDPVGRLIAHSTVKDVQKGSAPDGERLDAKIHWMRSSTVYETLGDIPWWIATLGAGLMAFVSRKKKAGESPDFTRKSVM
jgi:apolipoprotein N-acyltransferase